MANVLEKIVTGGGILPALASGKFGKDNAGFGLGILPGLAYKNRMRKKADGTPEVAPEEAGSANQPTMKKGGKVKKMAKGGSASKRADGCVIKGKTKGRMV